MSLLQDKRIVVTRPRRQSKELLESIQERGAVPILYPVIEAVRTEAIEHLDQALRSLSSYSWVVFTSVNSVRFVLQRLEELGMLRQEREQELEETVETGEDTGQAIERIAGELSRATGKEASGGMGETAVDGHPLQQVKLAAIGAKTAQTLRKQGLEVAFTPSVYQQEVFVAEFRQVLSQEDTILFPKGNLARPYLVEQLVAEGFEVDGVEVYRTIPVEEGKDQLLSQLAKDEIDVITFSSSSTVDYFMQPLDPSQRQRLEEVVIACIGPITADTARRWGLRVDIVANPYTIEGLMQGIEDFYLMKAGVQNGTI